MECNRDEAERAKTIAEEKMGKKDYIGAKKLVIRAQSLYPGLEGLSQMLTTLDIYISAAENKNSGLVDWYGVLGVSPSADDETIKKNYRKLALLLHPDKNKSVGADGAFKIISEAWRLLSDRSQRLAYNQRRGSGTVQTASFHAAGQTTQSRQNGIYNPASRTPAYNSSMPKPQNNGRKIPKMPTPTPPSQRHDTFWTICHKCKIHYEFVRTYLNGTLLCPNCKKAFTASETSPPFNHINPSRQGPHQQSERYAYHQNTHDPGKNVPPAHKSVPSQEGPSSVRHASYQKVLDHSIARKAANVVQEAQNKLKRTYAESRPSASVEGEEHLKKRRLGDESGQYNANCNMNQGNDGFGTGNAPGSRIPGFSGTYRQPNSTRDLTPLEARNMLMAKALNDIIGKLGVMRSEETNKAACKEIEKKMKKQITNTATSMERYERNEDSDLTTKKMTDQAENVPISGSVDKTSKEEMEDASMTVPDPDFHDFDNDRTEMSFEDNEVWAAYDDDDGMPRFYALINKVLSRKPFKLKISWLNSKTNNEFSTFNWVASGFYKTCGEFRVGRYETCTNINAFSQKVNWSRVRGTVQIFPQRDDVWALYRNWSFKWDKNTPDDVIHKYDMVIILNDYNEERGVSVAPLVKVVGHKTVFRPNLDPDIIKRIPKEEMFRFSHRVPHHVLTGQEGENAPKGFLELDPAATPLELLHVITEANEDPVENKEDNCDEELLQSVVPSSSLDEDESADETNESS